MFLSKSILFLTVPLLLALNGQFKAPQNSKQRIDEAQDTIKIRFKPQASNTVILIQGFFKEIRLCKTSDCSETYPPIYPPFHYEYQVTTQKVAINLHTIILKDTTAKLLIAIPHNNLTTSILTEAKYIQIKNMELLFSAILLGISLSVLLITLYYYFIDKNILYLIFFTFNIFLILSSSIHFEYLSMIFLKALGYLSDKPDAAFVALIKGFNILALLLGINFAYHFLEVRNHARELTKWFIVTAVVQILLYSCIFFTPLQIHKPFVFFITIVTLFLIASSAFYIWLKVREREKLLFGIANLLFLLFYLLNIATNISFTNIKHSPIYFILGVTCEVLIFSYLISSKVMKEKRYAKEKLVQIAEELTLKNNEIERLSNVLAHNLRGPVAQLIGLSNIFELTNKEPTASHEVLKKLKETAQNLDSIIKKISLILALRQENLQSFELINIKELAYNIHNKFAAEIQETNANIQIELNENDIILGNMEYVKSILCNLINNAFKFREPRRKLQIRFTSERMGNYIYLKISDNGLGFPLDQVKTKIFEPFQRFHLHTEGKGLGLHLTKLLVEKMNGSIEIYSTPGKGTTVILKFPLYREAAGNFDRQ